MEVSQITESERLIFQKFAERVQDYITEDMTDWHLLKWLIARNFDLDQSEEMFRNSLEWRRSNNIDELLNWVPPEVLTTYFHHWYIGEDKFGCPLYLSCFGKTDIRGILQCVSKEDYRNYVISFAEKSNREMERLSKVYGKNIKQGSMLIDLKGLSMSQLSYKPGMDIGMEITKLTEANYPENLRRIFIINAPKIFNVVFSWIKPFLAEKTQKKIFIFDSDSDVWKPALRKEIDDSVLPVHYGGSVEDSLYNPELMCTEVPRHMYTVEGTAQVTPDMKTITVLAGEKIDLKFRVKTSNSILRWNFASKGGDIGWKIFVQDEMGQTTPVIPFERIACEIHSYSGEIVCNLKGTYVAEFDNSYSFWRSKTIWYSFTLEDPEENSHPVD